MALKTKRTAVILAAGDGKRMKSERPKVVCEVLFKPMVRWVEDACRAAGIDDIILVEGGGAQLVRAAVSPDCRFVAQTERRGTGHAVMMAKQLLPDDGDCLVLYGDAPLIDAETIEASYRQHVEQQNAVTVISARVADPTGYGRMVRDDHGALTAIVEQKDATPEILAIDEINSGFYWFRTGFLKQALDALTCDNAQGEYYLTDAVGIAKTRGERLSAHLCADSDVVLGANDRAGLRALNRIARERVLRVHLENGVDIPFDEGVIIAPGVQIGQDTRILPGTILLGNTKIGAGCEIGPNSRLENTTVGGGSIILSSYLTDSTVGADTSIGPFTQLRPDSHVGSGVKIGDFVELKNTTIGDKTSIAHLTYIGDSDVGALCNFGCGVVTANYDGKKKHRTTIGDRAFIGCNTNLISPVNVGEGAYTAAGTTVDEDVPAGALAIGRVRQTVKEGWADQNVAFKKEAKDSK